MNERLLEVTRLSVQYRDGGDPPRAAVEDVSFAIDVGEVIGLTGPSGCGKTTTALSITGLLPKAVRVSGSIAFRGRDLTQLGERELGAIRGASIAIVFQEPGLALHPLMSAGAQIADIVRAHQGCRRDAARARACEAMRDVGLGADLPRLYDAYPHELSGGQAQRVLLAQALVCRPSLVIADEPTSSLDSTLRAEILRLISRLREQHGTAFLLISHSTAVLRSVADKVLTMADGRLIAPGPAVSPAVRAYSPDRGRPSRAAPCDLMPVLSARGVTRTYRRRQLFSRHRAPLPAVAGVDLDVAAGSTLGLIGESGAGKSTLARCLAGLERADAGEIRVDGRDLVCMHRRDRLSFHRQVQMIQQDSVSALNPRFTAEAIVTEPLAIQGIGTRADRPRRARELMTMVGLSPDRAASRPSEFSGGERQRLAIARALALRPRVLILDEPFSALDHANRERILDLLDEWRRQHGLTCLSISHDLALMASFTSDLAVMHQGRIVERGPTARLLGAPGHPQTRALVAAAFPVPAATASLAG